MCKEKSKNQPKLILKIVKLYVIFPNVIFISIRSGDQKINKLYFACFIDMSINRHLSNIFLHYFFGIENNNKIWKYTREDHLIKSDLGNFL